jgi:thiamine biosynthesis lipoprotein
MLNEIIMGMPVTVEVVDSTATLATLEKVFAYFVSIDEKFSTYKPTSEISKINRGEIEKKDYSDDMQVVFALSEETRESTNGYFNILHNGVYDPSGIVKGWAIQNAATLLTEDGFTNFYVDAGGDIQVSGKNSEGKQWAVGIRDPFSSTYDIVKVVYVETEGVATSGTYIRGDHIYVPEAVVGSNPSLGPTIMSLTVIGPNIYEADRYATAAFAMGVSGLHFIEQTKELEGYMIDSNRVAYMTSGFEKYTKTHV